MAEITCSPNRLAKDFGGPTPLSSSEAGWSVNPLGFGSLLRNSAPLIVLTPDDRVGLVMVPFEARRGPDEIVIISTSASGGGRHCASPFSAVPLSIGDSITLPAEGVGTIDIHPAVDLNELKLVYACSEITVTRIGILEYSLVVAIGSRSYFTEPCLVG